MLLGFFVFYVNRKVGMPSGNTKDKQIDWTLRHTLTDQDMRELIQEKFERARMLQQANANRNFKEVA